MKQPNSIKTEILRDLITEPFITEQSYTWNSFRIRLSELRQDIAPIEIKSKWVEFTNHYGRKNQYKQHYLLRKDKVKAIKIYNQLIEAK